MVTKDILEQNILELEYKAAKDKQDSDKRHAELLEEILLETTKRVKTALDGDLGELLKTANSHIYKKNNTYLHDENRRFLHKKLKLNYHKTYIEYHYVNKWGRDEKELSYEEFYTDLQLGFTPDPNFPPTKLLIELLTEAGFKAEAITEQCDNYVYETYADGNYKSSKTSGTHPEYYIIIEW